MVEVGDGRIELDPSCLVAFIDETGDEFYSDREHPVFGLGGIAMPVADYVSWVRPQWRLMKEQHFCGADRRLHARRLRSPSARRRDALSAFLSTERFTRIVAVSSRESDFATGRTPYEITALSLLRRIEKAALRFPITSLALVLEESARAGRLAEQYLGPFDRLQIERDTGSAEGVIHHFSMPGALAEPGLEIADFVMHAVGGQVRARLRDHDAVSRWDYGAVFEGVSQVAIEYMSIDSVVESPR